jgi:glycosyltransferase involved in cell wall biosynthesis
MKTAVRIACETIAGSGCGLGNYLGCLAPAMANRAGPSRSLWPVPAGEAAEVPSRPPFSARVGKFVPAPLKAIIKRAIPRRAADRPPAQDPWRFAEEWVADWERVADEVICLLPHVVCIDRGRLDAYYGRLAERNPVWVIHDLHALHFPDQWDAYPGAVEMHEKRFALFAQAARRVIVHNEFTRHDAAQRLNIPPEKMDVIYLPPLQAGRLAKRPEHAEVLANLGIRPPYALWASSSTFAHKNHERLLRCWKALADRGSRVQLVCTGGRGPRWERVSALIDDLGLAGQAIFTGPLPLESMRIVTAGAHIAVCPTLFEGGGSGPAAEAVLHGVPVCCSRIPQLREQFDNRDDLCHWFDPLDEEDMARGVSGVLDNYPAALQHAARAADEYPRMRSWSAVAESYWRVLERVGPAAPGAKGAD